MATQSKINFVRELAQAITDFARAADRIRALRRAFIDRAYGVGSKNELKPGDVLQNANDPLSKVVDVTPEDVIAAINFAEQVDLLLTGKTTAPDAWGGVINRIRTDM